MTVESATAPSILAFLAAGVLLGSDLWVVYGVLLTPPMLGGTARKSCVM